MQMSKSKKPSSKTKFITGKEPMKANDSDQAVSDDDDDESAEDTPPKKVRWFSKKEENVSLKYQ